MEPREAAAYSYRIDNRMNILIATAVVSTFVAIMCGAALTPWGFLLLLVPVGIVIRIKRSGISKPLVIGSRYLILGERIIYYRTVTRARLDAANRTLTISPARGASLVISADKFPTNARKPDKIKANRAAKFDKVAARIVERLNAVAPGSVAG